jgi:hypothetical protein
MRAVCAAALAAATPLPAEVLKYCVDRVASGPDALRGSFGWYRAIDTTIAQNEQRKTKRLTLPVLAVGGEKRIAEGAANTIACGGQPGAGCHCRKWPLGGRRGARKVARGAHAIPRAVSDCPGSSNDPVRSLSRD